MSLEKHVVCVSTTRPSTSLSPSGGGGTMTVVDPITGACLSSLRVAADMSGKNALGISALSPYPLAFGNVVQNSRSRLALAYGSNRSKKGDTYAMLLSIRSASSPPILHWKCRLPEADLTAGMVVSRCGYYVIGGGASGTCFVWNSVDGGYLLRSFKAHYRSVTALTWSDCGHYLVTGGADGMVHSFSLMELVDQSSRSSKRTIAPLNTWSFHHFPVTCLTTMDSGRVASAAEDGHIEIMELFSKRTVATIKVHSGITCLTYDDNRLFAGTLDGAIFSIDLDAYAMHQSEKQGASLSLSDRQRQEQYLTNQERIFGKLKEGESESTRLYRSEWIGHDRPVTSIAFLLEKGEERLISGDRQGEVRIWDVQSRTSVKVVKPWSNLSGGATTVPANKTENPGKSAAIPTDHPISSLMIIAQPSDSSSTYASGGIFVSSATSHHKGQVQVTNLLPPLQKYSQEQQENTTASKSAAVPFLRPNRSAEILSFWKPRKISRKRQPFISRDIKDRNDESAQELEEARRKIAHLEEDLAGKAAEMTRWENVNNKLMAKLKNKG